MNLQLEDKTALVSGSSQGIGFAIADALAKEGATVVINSNKQELLVKTPRPQGNSHSRRADDTGHSMQNL